MWYGEGRPKVYGPLPVAYPSHLVGELPGDYGFDPLGLAVDPVQRDRYLHIEDMLHPRLMPGTHRCHLTWCMNDLTCCTPLIPPFMQDGGAGAAACTMGHAGCAGRARP